MVRLKNWPIMDLDNDDCLSVLFRKSLSAQKKGCTYVETSFNELSWSTLNVGTPPQQFPFTICESEQEVCTPATTTNPMTAMPEPTADNRPEPWYETQSHRSPKLVQANHIWPGVWAGNIWITGEAWGIVMEPKPLYNSWWWSTNWLE